MKDFAGKIAVITGGGTGMGRELCVALAGAGAHIAMCDVSDQNMTQTQQLAQAVAGPGVRITTHVCDVANESEMMNFCEAVQTQHETDHVHLVFNNAGIGGGGGFIDGPRQEWDRTFDVCWKGVYNGCRAFVPLLVASDEGHLINTSSVNGFWATLGTGTAHTAYSAAKFAVKGFTEALINDFRINAPHVGVSVVMPGHIGTDIAINSSKVLGKEGPLNMPAAEVAVVRERLERMGLPVNNVPDDDIRALLHQRTLDFRDKAPVTAAQAAEVILTGVREGRWRILVGEDAHVLDRMVREAPESAYEPEFMTKLAEANQLQALVTEMTEMPKT